MAIPDTAGSSSINIEVGVTNLKFVDVVVNSGPWTRLIF